MSRNFKITRVSQNPEYEVETYADWLTNFAKQQEKSETAVDASRKRTKENQVYLDQLNMILTKKQRYATVNDAVADMIERVGLNKIEAIREENKEKLNRIAFISVEIENLPASLKQYEDKGIKEFMKDFINSQFNTFTPHMTSVPQMQQDLLSVLQLKFGVNPEDIYSPSVRDYLQGLINTAKEHMPLNSERHPDGKIETDSYDTETNSDIWSGLKPATK